MEKAKKFWPLSFKVREDDTVSFASVWLMYAALGTGANVLCDFLGSVGGVWGAVVYILTALIEVYVIVGFVFCAGRLRFGADFDASCESKKKDADEPDGSCSGPRSEDET